MLMLYRYIPDALVALLLEHATALPLPDVSFEGDAIFADPTWSAEEWLREVHPALPRMLDTQRAQGGDAPPMVRFLHVLRFHFALFTLPCLLPFSPIQINVYFNLSSLMMSLFSYFVRIFCYIFFCFLSVCFFFSDC